MTAETFLNEVKKQNISASAKEVKAARDTWVKYLLETSPQKKRIREELRGENIRNAARAITLLSNVDVTLDAVIVYILVSRTLRRA